MHNMDLERLNQLKRIHFIGISGSFNSFCARYLMDRGSKVTASEINLDNASGHYWMDQGVVNREGQFAENITDDIELVIYPNALTPDNIEYKTAKQKNIPLLKISELTGLISSQYKTIPVAGTHGKTTTTAMIIWLLHMLDKTPNFIMGGAGDKIFGIDRSWMLNPDSDFLVLEACEYKRQFLERAPEPYVSVVTNIDLDHTDYYRDQDDYNSAFIEFLANTTHKIVMDADYPNEKKVFEALTENHKFTNAAVIDTDEYSYLLDRINLVGKHNQENALKAILSVKEVLGVSDDELVKAINDFPGLAMRFEHIGSSPAGNPIIIDYAHNPSKVAACIAQANEAYPGRPLIFVWQPHSVERTATFKDDFVDALVGADYTLIPDIYSPSRETEEERRMISPEELEKYFRSHELQVRYTGGLEPMWKTLLDLESELHLPVIVFASAGNLHKFVKSKLT